MNQYLLNLADNDEEKRLIARLDELADKALRGSSTISDFLDLRQQVLAEAVGLQKSGISWRMDGGYEEAERKRMLFFPDWEYEADHGIACLKITPARGTDFTPGHRDYLGAIMNLGIKREKAGDILMIAEGACVFMDRHLADYLCQQLDRVGASKVTIERMDAQDILINGEEPEQINGTVASLRIDALIALAFHISRSDASEMIAAGRVRLNHQEILKSSAVITEGDLLSIRGKGRVRVDSIGSITRKGRHHLQVSKW